MLVEFMLRFSFQSICKQPLTTSTTSTYVGVMDATIIGDPASYGGVQALKKQHPHLTISEIQKYLATQDWYTKHRQAIKKFKRNRVISSEIDAQWQIDLVDLSSISRYNNGYKFLLTCIDIVSRYAWVVPIKNKTAEATLQAFKHILECGRSPMKVQSDDGKEFWNHKMQNFFKSKNIVHFSTKSEIKAGVVERFHRTLKNKMWRYFTHKNTYKYIDVLQDFVSSYNNTIHGTLKMRPAEVIRKNEKLALRNLYGDLWTKPRKLKFKFNVGDKVRISIEKGAFGRGYLGNWSEEIFTVTKRFPRVPPVYGLSDWNGKEISGVFYNQQLQRITIDPDKFYIIEKVLSSRKRGRKREYFVKWLGYPEDHNSWIPAVDLQRLQ